MAPIVDLDVAHRTGIVGSAPTGTGASPSPKVLCGLQPIRFSRGMTLWPQSRS